jgi:hypothetical protein
MALVSCVCSCRASFVDGKTATAEHSERWGHFFVYGMAGHAQFDVRDACRSGRAHAVHVESTPTMVLLSVLTLGIYTPRSIEIECAPAERR